LATTTRGHGRVGRPWRTVQQQCFREESICWLCGQLVDQTLDDRSPWSRTADHLIQLQHNGPGNTRANLRISHRRCNTARSNRLRGLTKDQCACTVGLPCARVTPKERTCLTVDATSV
jgi:5-methylcytosine-specific restriction endonuclease McrA